MFASRLNRVEKSLQSGFSDLFKTEVLRNFGKEVAPQYAFRRLAKPVFLAPVAVAETVALPKPIPTSSPTALSAPPKSVPQPPQVVSPVDDVPLANRVIAMEWQRRLQHTVAQVNASLPAEHHVMAQTILPAELFSGETGRFLMIACDFYCSSFANTLLLPAMLAGAAHHKLPQHPRGTSDEQKSGARVKVLQLRTRMANEHKRVAAALERGDVDLLFKPNGSRPHYKQELAGICKSIAINALGLSGFVTHESRFNDALCGARA